MAGGLSKPKSLPNPSSDWISERAWEEILTLESLATFVGFADDFKNHLSGYKKIFDSTEPQVLFRFSISIFVLILI